MCNKSKLSDNLQENASNYKISMKWWKSRFLKSLDKLWWIWVRIRITQNTLPNHEAKISPIPAIESKRYLI